MDPVGHAPGRRLERRRFASYADEQSVALHQRLVDSCKTDQPDQQEMS